MVGDVILSVRDLRTYLYLDGRCNRAVDGVSFELRAGRTLCVVGESGCGKSLTASSILQLLPPSARIESGEIVYFGGEEPLRLDRLERNGRAMRELRGADLAMIFQDPMTALNPVYTVGYQIGENLKQHTRLSRVERRRQEVSLLADMGIPAPERRLREYPHQFSGGMRQRAMIAMAMACDPAVLVADEPTTALDVTVQAQVFALVERLERERETAVLLITHDMGVVSELADEVAVMYMGRIVEAGPARRVLGEPRHPYTKALLRSIPKLGLGKQQRLEPIQGITPDPFELPKGCPFGPRCPRRQPACEASIPPEISIAEGHRLRCFNPEEPHGR